MSLLLFTAMTKPCDIIIYGNNYILDEKSGLLTPIVEMVAFSEAINCLDKNTVPTVAE